MKTELNHRDIPQSTSYRIFTCGDPNCGPHIVLYNRENKPVYQMVLHMAHAIRLAEQMVNFVTDHGEDFGELQ